MDDDRHGVFATRAPTRPNRLGLSIVRLLGIYGNRMDIEGVDLLDETPLLDIKPYVPDFDQPRDDIRTGWLCQNTDQVETMRSDQRFSD